MQVKFSIRMDDEAPVEVGTGLEMPFERVREAYPIGQRIQFAAADGSEQIELAVIGLEFHFRDDRAVIKLALP